MSGPKIDPICGCRCEHRPMETFGCQNAPGHKGLHCLTPRAFPMYFADSPDDAIIEATKRINALGEYPANKVEKPRKLENRRKAGTHLDHELMVIRHLLHQAAHYVEQQRKQSRKWLDIGDQHD